MPALGLRWNRSDKAGGRHALDSLTSQLPETPRHSDQISRGTSSKPWDESPTQRAASVDIPRSIPSSHLNTPQSAYALGNNSSRDASPASRPSSSSKLSRSKLKSHASDTHLSLRGRDSEDKVPPVPSFPPAPTIITTAPTLEPDSPRPDLARKRSRLLFNRSRANTDVHVPRLNEATDRRPSPRKTKFPTFRASRDPFADLQKLAGDRREMQNKQAGALSTDLSLPARSSLSSPDGNTNSSRDNVSNVDGSGPDPDSGRPSGQFSWLTRKQRNRKSLFPLLADGPPPPKPNTAPTTAAASPRPSTSGTHDRTRPSGADKIESQRSLRAMNPSQPGSATPSSVSFAPHPALLRSSSATSNRSAKSSPPLAHSDGPSRHRSSTMDSNSGQSEETPPTPPFAGGSGRNSTSTAGRSSFSNLFGLGRFRQGDPHSPRQGSTTTFGPSIPASMSNSMSLSRDAIALPDRDEGETAIQYLERVEDMSPRSQIPSVLAQSSDEFRHAVMRSFMRKFAYFGDPLDMAIRKLLMEIDLPKETQQIDRVLQSFADRYHECNPGIFNSAGEAYFIAFSILMLQTDVFNKNNKRKMTKQDYVKNSSIDGISDDVLECFYDNIVYTPFIRVEDDQDVLHMRSKRTNRKTAKATKAAKAAIKHVPAEQGKKHHKEPLDPYTLIFESRLDTLRPSLKEMLNLEDPYTYLGTLPIFDRRVLRHSKIGVIQIESARSRPDAFMSQSGIENPEEAKVGLVDLPIDKVGVLWRKDPKKKTARSPWQEWGVILTGAGLYFFRNAGWVKNYLHQYESHVKHGGAGSLCFFKPPISQFKPDYRLPTDHGVALQDATYKRHKNAFCFFSHNGSEVFLADTESELNDWLAKLNHQAACKTAGIGPRGLIGGQYTGQRQRAIRRLEPNGTAGASQTVQTSTGDVTIQRGQIDHALAQQISDARKSAIEEKLKDAEAKLEATNKQLEDELRDARHLLILAPIQLKTRELLVHAAARTQERLDALRVEKWRFDCHREILNLDLGEEQRDAEKWQARIDKLSGKTSGNTDSEPGLKVNGAEQSGAIKSNGVDKKKRLSLRSPKHTPKLSQDSLAMADDEDFHTPPEAMTPTNFSPPHTPCSLPTSPTNSDSPNQKSPTQSFLTQRISTNTNYSQASRQQPRGPRPSLDVGIDNSSTSDPAVIADDETDTVKSELGDVPENEPLCSSRPGTPITPHSAKEDGDDKPSPSVNSPDRGRSRRVSFTRRADSQARHHIRQLSRKSASDMKEAKEAANVGAPQSSGVSAPLSTSTKSDRKHDEPSGLIRDKPLFTVHGKKASVVTLGGDWAGPSPEETLQRLKAAAATSSATASGKELSSPSTLLSVTKSPLSRMTSADEDGQRTEIGDDEKTPTPGSPVLNFDKVDYGAHPPRKSSLNSKDRRTGSVRTASSAGMSARSVETAIDETIVRNKKNVEASVS